MSMIHVELMPIRTPRRQIGPKATSFALLVALCLVLELLAALNVTSPSIIAAPSEVILSLGRLFIEDALALAVLVTLLQALAATLAAMLVGLPLGYALFRYEFLGNAYRGWLAAMFSAPLVLLYPIFLVVIGRNYGTTIAMGFITGMIPIAIYVCEALQTVPQTLLNVGKSFHLNGRQQFLLIQLPAAVPVAFTGLRLGLIYALVNVIGIEFLIDFGGLGRLVSAMFFRYDVPGMYAGIAFIVLISLVLLTALKKVEKCLRPL